MQTRPSRGTQLGHLGTEPGLEPHGWGAIQAGDLDEAAEALQEGELADTRATGLQVELDLEGFA
jgi:hypothetical protein